MMRRWGDFEGVYDVHCPVPRQKKNVTAVGVSGNETNCGCTYSNWAGHINRDDFIRACSGNFILSSGWPLRRMV